MRSASTTAFPLEVLTKIASSFILFKKSLFTRFLAEPGTCKHTISDYFNKSSNFFTYLTPGIVIVDFCVYPRTFISNAKALFAVSFPIFPKPIIPIVLPLIPEALE